MNKNLSKSLGKTLVESDLTEITTDVLETIIENEIIENDLIKSIPILNSIIGLGKTFKTISDFLFTQKLISFLSQISDIDKTDREEIISKIDSEEKYNNKVGNKLLHIIENSQDYITAKNIGKMFSSFLKNELTYSEFCKASLILNRIDYHDLEIFLQIPDEAYGRNGTENLGLEEVDNFFIISGLCSAESSRPEIEKNQNNFYEDAYEIVGGETIIFRTLIGEQIYNILNKPIVTNNDSSQDGY
jgi:hypothetical protein